MGRPTSGPPFPRSDLDRIHAFRLEARYDSIVTVRFHTRIDSGIRLDPHGRFWHDEVLVENPAILRAWHRGLERVGDGRYLIRFGWDWAFIKVEDAPYLVRRLVPDRDGLRLILSDESEESLEPSSLARSKEDVLYCRVKGDHRARLSRQAQLDVMEYLREESPGSFSLALGSRRWPIGEDVGQPPPLPTEGPEFPDERPGEVQP